MVVVRAPTADVAEGLEGLDELPHLLVMALPAEGVLDLGEGHGMVAEDGEELALPRRESAHVTSVHAHAMPASHAEAPATMPPGVSRARMATRVAPKRMDAAFRCLISDTPNADVSAFSVCPSQSFEVPTSSRGICLKSVISTPLSSHRRRPGGPSGSASLRTSRPRGSSRAGRTGASASCGARSRGRDCRRGPHRAWP